MGAGTLDPPVTVAVIEDVDVVVEGVRSWVRQDPQQRVRIVAAGPTIEGVLAGGGREADVLVLDLELGDRFVAHRVRDLTDAGHVVVVFSVHVRPVVVKAVLDAGAFAFLDKHAEKDHFVETLVCARSGTPIVTPSMAGGMITAPHLADPEA